MDGLVAGLAHLVEQVGDVWRNRTGGGEGLDPRMLGATVQRELGSLDDHYRQGLAEPARLAQRRIGIRMQVSLGGCRVGGEQKLMLDKEPEVLRCRNEPHQLIAHRLPHLDRLGRTAQNSEVSISAKAEQARPKSKDQRSGTCTGAAVVLRLSSGVRLFSNANKPLIKAFPAELAGDVKAVLAIMPAPRFDPSNPFAVVVQGQCAGHERSPGWRHAG